MNEKIDICRGLFAFVIVMTHSIEIALATEPESAHGSPDWIFNILLCGRFVGAHCVIGFFVISGYCIQRSVSRVSGECSFPLSAYLAARLSRILPLYYVALLFTVGVECMIADARPTCWPNGITAQIFLSQLVLIQNFTDTFGCYTASWSITNEMFYYIFYGVVVWVTVGRGIRATWLGLIVCLGVAVPLDVIYVGLYRSRVIYSLGMLFGMGTFWFLGALVADYRHVLERSSVANLASRFWPMILGLAVMASYSERFHPQIPMVTAAVAFTLMVVRFVTADRGFSAAMVGSPSRGWVEWLGLSSYPTYLFHGPILFLAGSIMMRWQLVPDWRAIWCVLVVIGISSGILLGQVAERPLMNWRAIYLRRFRPVTTSGTRVAKRVEMAGIAR